MSKRSRIVRRRMRAHENRNRYTVKRLQYEIDRAMKGATLMAMVNGATKYTPEAFEQLVFGTFSDLPVYDHAFPDLEVDPIIGRVTFSTVGSGPDGEARLTCELVFKEGTTGEQIADYATITGLTFKPSEPRIQFLYSDSPPFYSGKL